MSKIIRRTGIAGALALFLLMASLAPVAAVAAPHCRQRIERAEDNLRRAIRKHGERSRQAEQRRRELENARARCHGGRY
jgi:hypothetical protein